MSKKVAKFVDDSGDDIFVNPDRVEYMSVDSNDNEIDLFFSDKFITLSSRHSESDVLIALGWTTVEADKSFEEIDEDDDEFGEISDEAIEKNVQEMQKRLGQAIPVPTPPEGVQIPIRDGWITYSVQKNADGSSTMTAADSSGQSIATSNTGGMITTVRV